MNEELDPQDPAAPGAQAGLSEDPNNQPAPQAAPPEPSVQDVVARLEKAEQRNQELERRLTEQGRRLAQAAQAKEQVPQPETIDPNAYFADPAGYTRKVVTDVMTDFERRQEQKEYARRQMQRIAAERGMDAEQMQEYDNELLEAMSDPDRRIALLADIHRARNVGTAAELAKKAALEDAQRTARAVTTETTGSRPSPPGKSYEDMTTEELEAHVRKNIGVADYNY